MNGWRIFCDVDCNGEPVCMVYELTGLPFLPRVGESVDVPIFHDGSGDLIPVKNVIYWTRDKMVTLSLDFIPDQDHIATLRACGWVEWKTENMRGEITPAGLTAVAALESRPT